MSLFEPRKPQHQHTKTTTKQHKQPQEQLEEAKSQDFVSERKEKRRTTIQPKNHKKPEIPPLSAKKAPPTKTERETLKKPTISCVVFLENKKSEKEW